MRAVILLSMIGLVLFACSPKVTEPIVLPDDKPKQVVRPTETDNPCVTFAKLSASDRDKAETAYVLYRDMAKLKKYNDALPLWRTAYGLAPAANGRVKYQFDDGVAIYKHLYSNTEDEAMKRSYMDTVMMIYDKRVECFGEAAHVQGRKAFDMYYTFGQYTTEDETFELFRTAVDGMGDEVKYFVVNPFTKMLYDRVLDESMSKEVGSGYANQILASIDNGMANCKATVCDAWDIVNGYAPARLESLEGIKGFYDCSYFEKKYFGQYQANADDCDYINAVYRKLQYAGCPADNPGLIELAEAKKTKCYVAPPEPGPLKQGFDCYNAGDFDCAIQKFETYIDKTDDVAKKFKYTMVVAKIYYGDIKNFIKAREQARKAAKLNPNSGEPYILIGKLYASSGPLCGPGTGWDSQIVTWPAIDKFQYAKKIDPSVAAEATKWINTYKQYMPKKEDIFMRALKQGDTFKVGCWIQEMTTVRTAD